MGNIDRRDLLNYLNNNKELCERLMPHFPMKPEFNVMKNVFNDVIKFVEGMEEIDPTEPFFMCPVCGEVAKYCVCSD